MTAKDYLSQARFLDLRINAKIQQLDALNDLATKATSTLTGMPRNPSPAASSMADTVTKIVDLQAEINQDIDELVDLKKEIGKAIILAHNLIHPDEPKELVSEEAVELLASPFELGEYKDAIMEAMLRGAKREVVSEDTEKN